MCLKKPNLEPRPQLTTKQLIQATAELKLELSRAHRPEEVQLAQQILNALEAKP